MSLTQLRNLGIIANAGIATTKLGAGAVLQVVTATDTTARSTTSTSYVTGSNTLSVTITPSSASNKILIILSTVVQGVNNTGYLTIFKDGVNLIGATGFVAHYDGAVGAYDSVCFNYLDSPNTTSATTYQLYFRGENGNTVNVNRINIKASITCMEIKG